MMITDALQPVRNSSHLEFESLVPPAADDWCPSCERSGRLVRRMGRRYGAVRSSDPQDPRVRAACALIDERLADDLSLTVLADAVGLSACHFLRTFRAAVGTTPQRYILNQRLERARERLARTPASISRIASDLAFASASHLASTFRGRFGLTPSEYRRSAMHHDVRSSGAIACCESA